MVTVVSESRVTVAWPTRRLGALFGGLLEDCGGGALLELGQADVREGLALRVRTRMSQEGEIKLQPLETVSDWLRPSCAAKS